MFAWGIQGSCAEGKVHYLSSDLKAFQEKGHPREKNAICKGTKEDGLVKDVHEVQNYHRLREEERKQAE